MIEVIYDKQESTLDNANFVASIDLGLDNLVALTSNQPGFIPLLINGRPLKSINQFYNKRKARLESQLKGNRKTSPRIQRLTRCRNQKFDNYLHHASRVIVDHLVAKQIGTLVVGKNAQWKTEINFGSQKIFLPSLPYPYTLYHILFLRKAIGKHNQSKLCQHSSLSIN